MRGLSELTSELIAEAQRHNHRFAIVLAGNPRWCIRAALEVLRAGSLETALWISTRAPAESWSMPGTKARSVLGLEVDTVVFDAYSGFDPDAFGAISGIVRGGGLLLLLTPRLDEWPALLDPEHSRIAVAPYQAAQVTGRFLRRLVRVVEAAEGVVVVEQGRAVPSFLPREHPSADPSAEASRHPSGQRNRREGSKQTAAYSARFDSVCRSRDQREAVHAIVHVVRGQRRRPVVLVSDRGRGKSSALGIAAAVLLEQGLRHIVVTGPRLDSVQAVFEQAHRLLPLARASRAAVHLGDAVMEFFPPDGLLRSPVPAQLLLVDEAASIPTPLLEQLLSRYSRIAFATTVHGYEGTGRGFALRFDKILNRRTRGWTAIRLEEPIRWARNDPLEQFVFEALLLNASPAADEVIAATTAETCRVERLDRDLLQRDQRTLRQLFGLLVLAHYRTRPYDLRHLLDGPNLSVYAMFHGEQLVATALLAREGGFDSKTARAIWAGRIRPHGHLLPESLAAHTGLLDAPQLVCLRIMRIAVHPSLQGRGLGSQLIAAIAEAEGESGIDYMGSSFGATVELLRFWARSDFLPARLGVSRGASSGAHSAIVVRALTKPGTELIAAARERFTESLPHLLSDPLRELETELASELLRHSVSAASAKLSDQDWLDLIAFAFGGRVYEVCVAQIWKLVSTALTDPNTVELLNDAERAVLIVKVLQKCSWARAAQLLSLSGRAGVISELRRAVRKLISHYAEEWVAAEVSRI